MNEVVIITTTTTNYEFWNGQRLHSHPAIPIAIDTETEVIHDERQVPRLALATASDGQ